MLFFQEKGGMDQTYIYDLSDEFLNSLKLLRFDLNTSQIVQLIEQTQEVKVKAEIKDESYYKSDLHRYNLKRAQSNLPPVSEEEFEELLETESIEDISGSDINSESESDDQNQQDLKVQSLINKLSIQEEEEKDNDYNSSASHLHTKSPFILFESPLVPESKAIGIYKAVFTGNELDSPHDSLMSIKRQAHGKSAIFMIGGGHFAGAIISHEQLDLKGQATLSSRESSVNVILSKTFHRYTTRRKQGGAQGASDNSRGKAVSAGSSIRRYNEQALAQEVRELISEWGEHIRECSSIYIRANGPTNKKVLVGYDGALIKPGDERVKKLPFSTKRASLSEVKRSWYELTHLKIVVLPEPTIKTEQAIKKEKLPQQMEISPEQKEQEALANELTTALKKQKGPSFMKLIKEKNINVDEYRLNTSGQLTNTPTLLHYASANRLVHMVQILLLNLRASPLVVNDLGKVPAELGDSNTRRVFQIARSRLGEDYCDWDSAKVGVARTKAEFEEEDRKRENQIKEEKQKQLKLELALEKDNQPPTRTAKPVPNSNININGLSAEQKAKLMREQRARAAEARLKSSTR
ncbi:hypothetical protein KGF56_000962 [Candida oxycetoniae]|uniref:VLRF1 domain-containing protein n=1 Tax=Candida oxycetoniae TaxID=497107 RepID=A0AAI9T0U0_9ASCO|nr:uncharacterized protein KGF56_000962 [Candida oxycetoniae]KAI3406121.2 hypothetical protein KGF56_000962 [Candida oxycetoniae]